MNKPSISIVVAIYNAQKYLVECLESILSQTFTNYEVLLVNDGSTDNSLEICQQFCDKNSRFKIINKANGGYGSAMNLGLKNATGEYLAIVEPDDIIKNDMLQTLYTKAKENDLDIVKSGLASFNDENLEDIHIFDWSKAYTIPSKNEVFTIYDYPWFLAIHPSTVTCLYKLDFLRKHNITYVEAKGGGWVDNLFQVQTMMLAKSIMYIDKSFYLWRLHSTNSGAGLKDYTIPINRINEIHAWLDNNNLNTKVILEALYKRELNYVEHILSMNLNDITDYLDYKNQLKLIVNKMSDEIVFDSTIISKHKKVLYTICKENVDLARKIVSYLE